MASSVKALPTFGNIDLPVRIMHYDDKKDPKKFFQSGFAFFAVADDQADVTDDEGNELGSCGGCMGGHYQIHIKKGDERIHAIISVEDLWNLFSELLEKEETKNKINNMESIYNEYWTNYQDKKRKKEESKRTIAEIQKMQEEAGNAEKLISQEKKEALGVLLGNLIQVKKSEEKVKYTLDKGTQVIDDGGWDLKSRIDYKDVDADRIGLKIPINYACGIRIITKDGEKMSNALKNPRPVVELEINSFTGISFGAIHYYASLKFYPPSLYYENDPRTSSTPWDVNILGVNKLSMTHALEEWELKRYAHNYEHYNVGDSYPGFYTEEDAIEAGKKAFEKYFEEGWKLSSPDDEIDEEFEDDEN